MGQMVSPPPPMRIDVTHLGSQDRESLMGQPPFRNPPANAPSAESDLYRRSIESEKAQILREARIGGALLAAIFLTIVFIILTGVGAL